MSNLTDLLPAGAGGKQVDFVASGTIGNGVTVGLNSDGTVTAVAETSVPTSAGTPVVFESAQTTYTASSFDPVEQKVVVFYADNDNSSYGTAVVGTISGSSISFSTPVVFRSVGVNYVQATYDSVSGKHVILYNWIYGYAQTATVSGNSISFGADVMLINRQIRDTSVSADVSSGKILFFYEEQTFNYFTYSVGTISGTSISVGSATTISGSSLSGCVSVYDSSIGKVVIFYSLEPSNTLYAQVCIVSGTSLTFGTTVSPGYGQGSRLSATYDSVNEKTIVFYRDTSIKASVFTASGTTLSYGSAAVVTADNAVPKATYNSTSGKIVVVYVNYSNSSYGTFKVGTVSGTSISFGSAIVFESAETAEMSIASSSSSGATIVSYQDGGNSYYGTSAVLTIANTTNNSADFIGISDAAISDTASGSVTIKGGISTNVTGLTANLTYYVQDNGSLSTTTSTVLAGKALSSTSINLDYTT